MTAIYPETSKLLFGIRLIPINNGTYVEIIVNKKFFCHCDNKPEVIHQKVIEIRNTR